MASPGPTLNGNNVLEQNKSAFLLPDTQHIMDAGLCKLCRTTGELHKSHILPEFLYASTYDEKHRFILVPDSVHLRMGLEQKGLRETLLCSSCETRFSQWETYAARVLFQTDSFPVKDETYGFTVHGVDYLRMKLFQLSILWRMGVSSFDMFKQVKLGPHEERLRLSLLQCNPGEYHFYPCLFLHVSNSSAWLKRAITAPTLFKYEGHSAYRFFAAALMFAFIVSKEARKIIDPTLAVSPKGILPVLKDTDNSMLRFTEKMFPDKKQLEKMRKLTGA